MGSLEDVQRFYMVSNVAGGVRWRRPLGLGGGGLGGSGY